MYDIFTLENATSLLDTFNKITAIGSSSIVIYLFLVKGEKIASLYKVLRNYTQQVALSDLRAKLHSLERFKITNGDVESNKDEVVNLLSEIAGQLKGNPLLKSECSELIKKIESIIRRPESLTEPQKRIIGHELFEVIRHINLNTYNNLVKKKD